MDQRLAGLLEQRGRSPFLTSRGVFPLCTAYSSVTRGRERVPAPRRATSLSDATAISTSLSLVARIFHRLISPSVTRVCVCVCVCLLHSLVFPFPLVLHSKCFPSLFLRPALSAVCFHPPFHSLSLSRETTGKVRVHQLLRCQVFLSLSLLSFFLFFATKSGAGDRERVCCRRVESKGETQPGDEKERKEERKKGERKMDSIISPFLVTFIHIRQFCDRFRVRRIDL